MNLAQSNQIGKLSDLKTTIVSAPTSNGSGKTGSMVKFGSPANSPTPIVSVSIATSNGVLSSTPKLSGGDAEMANDLMQADGQLTDSKNFTMSIKTPTLQQHLLRKSPHSPIEAKSAIASQS